MRPPAAIQAAVILVAPHLPSIYSDSSCLSRQFYGNYLDGSQILSVMIPDQSCLELSMAQDLFSSAHIAEVSKPAEQLVWVAQEAVDMDLLTQTRSFRNEFDGFLDLLSYHTTVTGQTSGQTVMSTDNNSGTGYELLYRTPTAALLSVSSETARTIDTLVPRFWKSTLLPTSPVTFSEVSPSSVEIIQQLIANIKYDPIIASLVESISIPQMSNDIQFLTGEDSLSGIVSRHSFADGAIIAAEWLKERFEATGAVCDLWPFQSGFAPNVVCSYPPLTNSTDTILISAHYDSRGSFGSTRAPGGDDDGSGTTALLAIARTIYRKGIRFHNPVKLVAFAGEEQGLLGSRAYARHLKFIGANLTFALQADMLAYRQRGEPLQLGMPDIIGTPVVANLVSNVSALYSPELDVGLTPACCSDHQSFIEQGFPAIQLFERNGPIIDPMYHNSGDISQRAGYDFEQLKSIAKVQLATVLHAAGYKLSK